MDNQDVRFIMRGWLYLIYWMGNAIPIIVWVATIIATIVEGTTGIIGTYIITGGIIVVPLLILFNRLWYECAIAIFEIVKHLRQIRDILRSTSIEVKNATQG